MIKVIETILREFNFKHVSDFLLSLSSSHALRRTLVKHTPTVVHGSGRGRARRRPRLQPLAGIGKPTEAPNS